MAWMGLWWIVGALAIAILAWAAMKGTRGASGSSESAEEILRRRYAMGELDEETFERMRDELRHA